MAGPSRSRRPQATRALAVAGVLVLVLAPAAAAKTIKGTGKNDVLKGTKQADTISGLNGNDKITANGGADTVSGGTGNDTIYGNGGADKIQGNLGHDVVYGGANNDTIVTSPPKQGAQSPDNDKAYGESGDDTIATGAGNDLLDGGTGRDILNADTGDDVLHGGPDNDYAVKYKKGDPAYSGLNGGAGNDRVYGDDGDDWLHGLDGNDLVDGGEGNDHPSGGTGNDRVYGGPGRDQLDGDVGDDFLDAGPGNDSCPGFGTSDNPTAEGNSCLAFPADGVAGTPDNPGNSVNTTGDAGNDVIYVGEGIDVAFGEEGFDTFVLHDDGVYDRIFCADSYNDDGIPADISTAGRVIYVGDVDPLDNLRNCQDPVSMTEQEFCDRDDLTYPNSQRHLPLPATMKPCAGADNSDPWWPLPLPLLG